jgi:predicted dehydrogenase
MTDFCEAVREGTTPRSSHELGLEVVRMIEAVEASLEDGRRVELEAAASAIA